MTTSLPDVSPHGISTEAGQRTRARRCWFVAFSILSVVLVAGLWFFLHLGTWLVVQDPLSPADVIVVLSGRMPYRALEAARLYEQEVAAQVWVTRPGGPGEQLAEMHIPFVGEDFYSQRVLMARNVPVLSIRILPGPTTNTADEIAEIGRLAREANLHTVLIVTSAPHTRRVHAIWKRLVGDSPQLIVRHPIDDGFNASQWWWSTQDSLDVVREWLGLANAWAGFPAKPSQN